jgi:hypothetical protein
MRGDAWSRKVRWGWFFGWSDWNVASEKRVRDGLGALVMVEVRGKLGDGRERVSSFRESY